MRSGPGCSMERPGPLVSERGEIGKRSSFGSYHPARDLRVRLPPFGIGRQSRAEIIAHIGHFLLGC